MAPKRIDSSSGSSRAFNEHVYGEATTLYLILESKDAYAGRAIHIRLNPRSQFVTLGMLYEDGDEVVETDLTEEQLEAIIEMVQRAKALLSQSGNG